MDIAKRGNRWGVGIFIVIAVAFIVFVVVKAGTLYTELSNVKVAPPQPYVTYRPVVKKEVPTPVPTKAKPDAYIPPVQAGLAPLLTTIHTTQPVVFLGIDDGAYKAPEVVTLLKKYNIKATLFLADAFIHSDPQFFAKIQGAVIEDHTTSHDLKMATKSLAYQQQEICSMADTEQKYYGRRPILFRPPGGAYTQTTLRAAANCGMRAVVNWIAKANGGSMQYQIGNKLRPGDIVLMHFRPEFKQDLEAFVAAETAAGLHTELLEDWIKA